MTFDKQTRREFSLRSVQTLSTGSVVHPFAAAARAEDDAPKPAKTFRLCATSDAHVGTDLKHHCLDHARTSHQRSVGGESRFLHARILTRDPFVEESPLPPALRDGAELKFGACTFKFPQVVKTSG